MVFQARDTELESDVAIKVLPPEIARITLNVNVVIDTGRMKTSIQD